MYSFIYSFIYSASEITPTAYRQVATVMCAAMFDVGVLIASGMAVLLTNWRALQLAGAVICVPCVILLIMWVQWEIYGLM